GRETQRAEDSRLVGRLTAGDAQAWSRVVERYGPVIYGAVHKTYRRYGRDSAYASDVVQDVFLRLCNDDYRLLRQYDSTRAALSTWLTIVATSGAVDSLRRKRPSTSPLDAIPEHLASVEPKTPDGVKIPNGLLSPRQALIMQLLYERDMEVAEVAAMLAIDAQTVRSTHHKALLKLRAYFAEDAEDRG